ncbi:MAG: type II secretion system F family protein [Desulfobacteraceae bacterium]|nr:type II secretion system F family protein [Desulfobacteraceae bacterium]
MIRKIKHYAHDSRTTFAYSNVSEIKSSKLYNLFSVWGSKVVTPGTHDYSHMRLRFLKAGIRYSKAAEICWGVKCFLALIIPVVFIMTRLALFKLTNNMATLVICVLGALAGYYLPDLWLRLKVQARKKKLLAALPDALDLMVVCVEAGMGLDGAFSRVAEEIHLNSPEMSEELKMMNLEMRAGKSRQNALQDLAVRSDLDEMNSLVTLLIQTDKFGTSMAASLRVFSDAYRTKRYQRAEELAAKIPVKLVFPLVLFIFPSLFAVILGPAAIRIWQNIISK